MLYNSTYIRCLKVKVSVTSRVQLFVTPWTMAHQAPLPMGFSRQEYWSGLPFPFPGDLPNQGTEPHLLHCRQILYHLRHQGRLHKMLRAFKFMEIESRMVFARGGENEELFFNGNRVSVNKDKKVLEMIVKFAQQHVCATCVPSYFSHV